MSFVPLLWNRQLLHSTSSHLAPVKLLFSQQHNTMKLADRCKPTFALFALRSSNSNFIGVCGADKQQMRSHKCLERSQSNKTTMKAWTREILTKLADYASSELPDTTTTQKKPLHGYEAQRCNSKLLSDITIENDSTSLSASRLQTLKAITSTNREVDMNFGLVLDLSRLCNSKHTVQSFRCP